MRTTSTRLALLGLLLFGSPSLGSPSFGGLSFGSLAAHAQEPEAPRDRTPAAIMSFRGADWLERPQRAAEEMPDRVVDAMGLEPGDVVADIGAGSGYFTRRMAPLVSPGGMVYAVDVQPEMLDLLMESVEAEGLTGVEPVLGAAADPRLPAGVVDWVLMVDVYHELEDPATMLARLREALAPGGRVALLEYRAEDGSGEHIRAEHRMSVRQVLHEWDRSGFRLRELHEFLPSQHLFVLAPTAPGGGAAAEAGLPHYDFLEAVEDGVVEANLTGTGRDAVVAGIRRTRPEDMVVTLPAGAWFEAQGEEGDVIARRDAMVVLREDRAVPWVIETRRAEQDDSPAEPGAPFQLRDPEAGADVRDLMWLFQNADVYPAVAPTVEQIALWITTQDADWETLSAHARSTSVHAANAVALATAYTNGAGIDVRRKRIWQEREQFVPAITDEGLRRAFEQLEGN